MRMLDSARHVAIMQNLDNYIPFRLAYLEDNLVADFPEVWVGDINRLPSND